MSELIAWPFGFGTVFIEPMHGDGKTASGIKLQHHVNLPKVYARVVAVGEGAEGIQPDDFVVLFPHAEIDIGWSGENVVAVNEGSIRAVIEGPNGRPYFEERDEDNAEVHPA
jgi:co-chaperonin GroES (HSP10)